MQTAVVTVLTEGKCYCLAELLASFRALQAPEGETLRFVVGISGRLSAEHAALLEQWASEQDASLFWEAEITEYEDHAWRRSLIAGTLRERARQSLLPHADDWVLWIDCDTLADPDALVRLRAHGRALVSGLVLNRLDGSPIAGTPITGYPHWDPDVTPGYAPHLALSPCLQDVGWVGFGCFLVRGDLAREVSFQPYLDGRAEAWLGEDGYFCREAAKLSGDRVWLDTTVCPWHVDASGIALRAHWEDGTLGRRLKTAGEDTPTSMALVPRVTGRSVRFGELVAGQPFDTDAEGRTLSAEEMREIAEGSHLLDLLEGAELAARVAEIEAAAEAEAAEAAEEAPEIPAG